MDKDEQGNQLAGWLNDLRYLILTITPICLLLLGILGSRVGLDDKERSEILAFSVGLLTNFKQDEIRR